MIAADARALPLRPRSVACAITSPPYIGERVYGDDEDEIGREPRVRDYLHAMVAVGRELRDPEHGVLADDGLWWLNVGDKANGSGGAGGDYYSANGSKRDRPKPPPFYDPEYERGQFLDVPGKLAWALQADGWRLRNMIIWNKVTQTRESMDHARRPRRQTERILMLAPTRERTRFFPDRLKETGDVWTFRCGSDAAVAHLAPFPDELAERCMLPSTEEGDVVLDMFAGSGTVERVAERHGRIGVSCDLYAGRMWAREVGKIGG